MTDSITAGVRKLSTMLTMAALRPYQVIAFAETEDAYQAFPGHDKNWWTDTDGAPAESDTPDATVHRTRRLKVAGFEVVVHPPIARAA